MTTEKECERCDTVIYNVHSSTKYCRKCKILQQEDYRTSAIARQRRNRTLVKSRKKVDHGSWLDVGYNG